MEILEKVIVLSYGEFDDLVNERIYGGDEVVECVADNEWNNYEDHLFRFNNEIFLMEMEEDSYYRKYNVPEIKSRTCGNAHTYFTYMWEHQLIEKTNYLIRINW